MTDNDHHDKSGGRRLMFIARLLSVTKSTGDLPILLQPIGIETDDFQLKALATNRKRSCDMSQPRPSAARGGL
jgi:hypothetical protein